jgi:hypothetical protein
MLFFAEGGVSEGIFALAGTLLGSGIAFWVSYWQLKRARTDARHDKLYEHCTKVLAYCCFHQMHKEAETGRDISEGEFKDLFERVSSIAFLANQRNPLERELARQAQKVWETAFKQGTNRPELVKEMEVLGAKLQEIVSLRM